MTLLISVTKIPYRYVCDMISFDGGRDEAMGGIEGLAPNE